MVQQKKEFYVKSRFPSTQGSLLLTGLGLLTLTLITLSRLIQFSPTGIYNVYMVIFLFLFASVGFVLIILGTFLALKTSSNMKSIASSVLDHPSSVESPSQHQFGGLQILRPTPSLKKAQESSVQETQKQIKTDISPKITEDKTQEKTKKEADVVIDFSVEDGLQSIVDRYNTEKVKKAFRDWNNTLMMTFPNISKSFLFIITGDEGIQLKEGKDEEAAVQVIMDSTIFVKMMTKQINPIKAYSSGNLEVKGEMKNMLKLRKLMF